MKRFKSHKVKTEMPETSTSHTRQQKEHDLAYYIHDRVELMHQVFSVLKYKELKAMAPDCVRDISIDDLQELCTEELLGISSKRLCAILDGAEPPSDTESSSQSPSPDQDRLETISLDSISSDEEILSQASSRKKHKHKHRRSKSKTKKQKSQEENTQTDKSKASRAGLTVLELLELQARARAIRAQLHKEQVMKQAEAPDPSSSHNSDNEVEIKEEPPEVVEISSDEEKPKIEELELAGKQAITKETQQADTSSTITKRVSDLVITVPQAKTRKIKLNRNKVTVTVNSNAEKTKDSVVSNENANKASAVIPKVVEKVEKAKDKTKKKKKDKKMNAEKEGSDHDEIMLQLSDSEKLDLLESLDRKNFDNVTSSSSEDSESSSSDSDADVKNNSSNNKSQESVEVIEKQEENAIDNKNNNNENTQVIAVDNSVKEAIEVKEDISEVKHSEDKVQADNVTSMEIEKENAPVSVNIKDLITEVNENSQLETEPQKDYLVLSESGKQDVVENKTVEDTHIVEERVTEVNTNKVDVNNEVEDNEINDEKNKEPVKTVDCDVNKKTETQEQNNKAKEKELSEGELSDRTSSEVEAFDLKPEVVCISDEEVKNKKKKKKEKKSKKQKKSKKLDFQGRSDQNFYKDPSSSNNVSIDTESIKNGDDTAIQKHDTDAIEIEKDSLDKERSSMENHVSNSDKGSSLECKEPIIVVDDDGYEILELSDDSSCYEVEGTVLSKEPTAEEIEALSAKIDEIEREEVVTDEQISEYEKKEAEKRDSEDIENISWKDRYLESSKVKKVLSTASILNALRKKNKELKKKLQDNKAKIEEAKNDVEMEKPEEEIDKSEINLEEGSIEQYNTLEGLTKYVDPVPDPEKEKEDGKVTREMKKDAKQLLKMYKKLLKYNDMNKQKDPKKKKKKKHKKEKDKSKNGGGNAVTNENI